MSASHSHHTPVTLSMYTVNMQYETFSYVFPTFSGCYLRTVNSILGAAFITPTVQSVARSTPQWHHGLLCHIRYSLFRVFSLNAHCSLQSLTWPEYWNVKCHVNSNSAEHMRLCHSNIVITTMCRCNHEYYSWCNPRWKLWSDCRYIESCGMLTNNLVRLVWINIL